VAEPVVDQLELVHVDDADDQPLLPWTAFLYQSVGDVEELAPVEGIGERIALGRLDQLRFQFLALGDVEDRPGYAARTAAATLHRRLVEHHMALVSVGMADLALVDLGAAALQKLVIGGLVAAGERGRRDLKDGAADDAVGWAADELGKGGVAADIDALSILEKDRRGQRVDAGLEIVAFERQPVALLTRGPKARKRTTGAGETKGDILARNGIDHVVGAKRDGAGAPFGAQPFRGNDDICLFAERAPQFADGTAQPLRLDRHEESGRSIRNLDEVRCRNSTGRQRLRDRTAVDGEPENLTVLLLPGLPIRTRFRTGQMRFRFRAGEDDGSPGWIYKF